MASHPHSSENEKNSYIFDPESAAEMARLMSVDQFTTRGMGGPFAEQNHPTAFSKILDIACGPGGWVLDVAFEHPTVEVAGVDLSKIMVDYARARAHSQGLPNASFEVMDVTQPLQFSQNTFDLVNGRLLGGFLRRTDWPHVVEECSRILRPGGILRLTELDIGGITTSGAFNHLNTLASRALWHAGYGFSPDGETLCLTPMLSALLQQAGYQNIRQKPHAINFSAGTDSYMDLYRNYEVFFHLLKPMLLATEVTTEEAFDHLYQQMLGEMLRDDFRGIWYFLTAWGTTPPE